MLLTLDSNAFGVTKSLEQQSRNQKTKSNSPQRRSIIPKTRWPDSRGQGRSLENAEKTTAYTQNLVQKTRRCGIVVRRKIIVGDLVERHHEHPPVFHELRCLRNQLTKQKSGGLLLLRRNIPLSRRAMAYFYLRRSWTVFDLRKEALSLT